MSYCEWDDPLVYTRTKRGEPTNKRIWENGAVRACNCCNLECGRVGHCLGPGEFGPVPQKPFSELLESWLLPKQKKKEEEKTMFVIASKYHYGSSESFGVTDEKFETYDEALEDAKKLLSENRDEVEAYIFEHKFTVKRNEEFTVEEA